MSGRTSAQYRYASLDAALRAKHIPLENHELIRRFTDAIGCESYYDRSSYIKAVRADGGPNLLIAYGWSTGFTSEDEARSATRAEDCWQDKPHSTRWGVSHPVNKIGQGGQGAASRTEHRTYDTCPECFTEFAASGDCRCEG
ncbi:hypothetical protein [Microbacterium sp. 2FI]|uniref:hypothetical protein n=1 Tax=Microbacterium sp. 2FI TaxID=2502193 RepID=UPI0010F492B9|nr:hypothetical protein [Microbacterium sp. 2FI]